MLPGHRRDPATHRMAGDDDPLGIGAEFRRIGGRAEIGKHRYGIVEIAGEAELAGAAP